MRRYFRAPLRISEADPIKRFSGFVGLECCRRCCNRPTAVGSFSTATSSKPFRRSICHLCYASFLPEFRACSAAVVANKCIALAIIPVHPSLVARTKSSSAIAVEVFIEPQVVAPVGVSLEFRAFPVHRSPAILIAEKNACKPSRELSPRPGTSSSFARARRAFDSEILAVIHVVHQQCADDEPVDGYPYRSPPVRVDSEHSGVGLRWKIRDAVVLTPRMKYVGMLEHDSESAREFRTSSGTPSHRASSSALAGVSSHSKPPSSSGRNSRS